MDIRDIRMNRIKLTQTNGRPFFFNPAYLDSATQTKDGITRILITYPYKGVGGKWTASSFVKEDLNKVHNMIEKLKDYTMPARNSNGN